MSDPYGQDGFRVRCDWGPVGADAVSPGAVVLAVVDVLSFTTALSVAVDRGISVLPCRWRDERAAVIAEQYEAMLAVGRSQVGPQSPVSLSPATIAAVPGVRRLVLPSPNGSTIAQRMATSGATVIGVSLRNAAAAAVWTARQIDGDGVVAVVAAGERWRADDSLRPAVEDLWGAGMYIAGLVDAGIDGLSPEAEGAMAAYLSVAPRIAEKLSECASGRELIGHGYPQDVEVAAEVGVSDVVPVLHGEWFAPVR
ncbi:MAG TPA: 2-phosphosulfolactate phosphatase [Jiangellales bacterium]|nr:2-phosphosulfolactate phosphatase [Jiangellales bacterium]